MDRLDGWEPELVNLLSCARGALPVVAAAGLLAQSELGLLERVVHSERLGDRLLVADGELRLEPRQTWEVVVSVLDATETAALHRRIARALAALQDGSHTADVALHAARGGDEPLLLETVERGLRDLAVAGRHPEVAEVADRAAASPGLAVVRTVELLNHAETADALAGRNDRRMPRLERVRELAAGLDDPEERFLVHIQLCVAATDQGDHAATEQLARRALAIGSAPGHRRAEAWRHLGLALVAQGRLREAVDAYRAGIELSD